MRKHSTLGQVGMDYNTQLGQPTDAETPGAHASPQASGAATAHDASFRDLLTVSEALLNQWPPRDRQVILQILAHNLNAGRAQKVISRMNADSRDFVAAPHAEVSSLPGSAQAANGDERLRSWTAYHLRVVDVYRQEQARITALAANDPQAWRLLWDQLDRRAYQLLVQRGVSAEYAREKSAEVAQQACERVFVSVFPCDVPFEFWVQTILKNVVLQYLTRSRDLLDRQPAISSLDDLEERGINYPLTESAHMGGHAPVQDLAALTTEMQSLIEAIERIHKDEWRAVIVYTYFTGLSDDEIATRLGRTKGFVYTAPSCAKRTADHVR
ncbi:MAG: hypothetical protein IPK16_15000 [Anaerolineales bacterium]|nr:hypothetical protein [Anaerolineales bacterium]